nr:AraC family transcriptional regulator [Evansella caseinilytica]
MNNQQPFYETIGFRTHDKTAETHVDIYVVGRDNVTSTSYYWDGRKRGEHENFIFQYTLAGEGAIDVGGRTYKLQAGQAFMVGVPGDHCYYLPKESGGWEFIFLTLTGPAAALCWKNITGQFGHVVSIPRDTWLIKDVFSIYQQAHDQNLIDHYYASSRAYAFIMECYRYFRQFKTSENLPDSIARAVHFIQAYYATPLTVEEIASAAGISKYYLIKRFREMMNMTPVQYLTKVRLEKAFELLSYSNDPIKEIAVKVGYANDNYFNKVFRRIVGISPGEFRRNKHSVPFNRLVIR